MWHAKQMQDDVAVDTDGESDAEAAAHAAEMLTWRKDDVAVYYDFVAACGPINERNEGQFDDFARAQAEKAEPINFATLGLDGVQVDEAAQVKMASQAVDMICGVWSAQKPRLVGVMLYNDIMAVEAALENLFGQMANIEQWRHPRS